MNPERFDQVIGITLSHYGPIGVDVELLSVKDRATPTPPNDWYQCMVEVSPVTMTPTTHADTWNYGGVISHTTGPVPLGIRTINQNKIIKATEAAQKLPPGFPLNEASCNLYWPLVPGCNEPLYSFHTDQTLINIGAYTGKVL